MCPSSLICERAIMSKSLILDSTCHNWIIRFILWNLVPSSQWSDVIAPSSSVPIPIWKMPGWYGPEKGLELWVVWKLWIQPLDNAINDEVFGISDLSKLSVPDGLTTYIHHPPIRIKLASAVPMLPRIENQNIESVEIALQEGRRTIQVHCIISSWVSDV